jgi:periplasmic protein TonB
MPVSPPEPYNEIAASASPGASATSSADTASRIGDEFVPRRYLTVVPKATTDITVFYPETSDSVGKRTAILALFIDESGVVQRVRIDGPPLPSDMEDAARNAFLSARFTPGEREGRIVKSLIRIEVTFELTPLPQAAEAPTPPEPH